MLATEMWEILEEREIATYDELRLVTNIIGMDEEALEGVLYSRLGLNSFEQLLEEDED